VDNGFGTRGEPILGPMTNIREMDAILDRTDGQLREPEWPEADVIVGNPPFLQRYAVRLSYWSNVERTTSPIAKGHPRIARQHRQSGSSSVVSINAVGAKKLRSELGDDYVEDLFSVYKQRLPGMSDLVCYWFEKARVQIEGGKTKRAGLIATNSIRGGLNRRALERIKQSGDIFFAEEDRPWILNGAAVRVSMVGFDNGSEQHKVLDGAPVQNINAALTGSLDLSAAKRLRENTGLGFVGDLKGGKFDIPGDLVVLD
jgi:hypothetical protein